MTRKLLIVIAAAALAVPVSKTAFARDDHDHGRHAEPRRDAGYDRGGYDRGYRRDDHHDHDHGRRFIVHYHLDGSRRAHTRGHDRAHELVEFLREVGARAHIDGDCTVHYTMRGSRTLTRGSHQRAHELVARLERWGFHAHVDHE